MSCSVEVWGWPDLDPGWPAASWSWSHSDLESLLRWPDDSLLQWPDPDPGWPEWRWPAGQGLASWRGLALFIRCITAPCLSPVLQVGRRLAERLIDHLMCDKAVSRASWRALLSACITAARWRSWGRFSLDKLARIG